MQVSETASTCNYIFKSGKNKGKPCGKANCKQHDKITFPLQDLPQIALITISKCIINNFKGGDNFEMFMSLSKRRCDAFDTLLALSRTCKNFKNIIEPYWEVVYEKFKKCILLYNSNTIETYMSELSYVEKLQLLLKRGCQLF
jgi:hypothetical protein